MMRRLFNVLAGLSLLLCVALCVGQYREFAFSYAFSPTANAQKWFGLTMHNSRLSVEECTFSPNPQSILINTPDARGFHPWRDYLFLLFAARISDLGRDLMDVKQIFLCSISIWYLVLSTAILPVIVVFLRLRPRRPRPGYCQQCGYDLRATPDRCPECGTIPKKVDQISK